MEYSQAILKLKQFKRLGINLGLQRINDMLQILGNPEEDFPIVHIGGTNGKGSTVAMLESMLREAGYRVGVFSSPHLLSHRERFVINGENIAEKKFVLLFTEVLETLAEVQQDTGEIPTEFEILTAMAFLYFAREKVDIALIEVGLGGDFDSTNVMKKPLLSIITNVSFDHQYCLGNTLGEIAEKKSGIIKQGCPVVTASKEEEVLQVIRQKAQNLQAPLWEVWREAIWEGQEETRAGQYFTVQTSQHNYGRFFLPMRGAHQLENAVTAILAGEVLQKQGWRMGTQTIKDGLAKVKWSGRLELIGQNPLFVLDGAHNPAGFRALAQWLAKKRQEVRRIILVIGMLDDKDGARSVCLIEPLVEMVIITRPDSERTERWRELKDCFQGEGSLFCIENLEEAIKRAQEEARAEDLVLVTGSLHLMGKAREILQN
ncbi:MAG TPA: bifunctional folylpolyglutamate synthase/dihydrofolate synthase [Clostridia bacterium]|nr:bifunctional folylpolyglutamate synthase/dihydrofolate synthase [Clostridia bacterium]